MKRSSALAFAAILSAACGAGQKDVVPHLPGDGDENTARPRAGVDGAATDWWSGRTLIAPPPPLGAAPLPMPPHERFALKNGLTVIAVESSDAPTVQVQLAIKSGRQSEPREKVGVSSFVASMLTRGARGKSESQLTAALEQAGAQLTSNASYETLVVNCHAPAAGRATCLDSVAAMATAPSFPAGAIAEVRNQLTNAARQSRADPTQLTNLQFQNALWGDENARGWAMSEKSVAAIQRADLVAWHKAQFTPKNAVLLVVGPPAAQVKPAVERAFGSWQGAAAKAPAVPPPPQLRGMKIRLVDVPGMAQAHVRVGRTGVAHRDPDFPAASVVNHVLGGSDASRIGRAIRKSFAGRAAASASFDRNLDVGAFVAAGVAPTPEAVALMRTLTDQIAAMAADGPSAAEVKAAVTELVGGYQTRLESTQEIGNALLAAELHGFDSAYVRDFGLAIGKVTAGMARSSAARWLDGKNLVVVLTGNAQVIEPQLMEAGLKYDRVSQEPGAAGAGGSKVAEPTKPASPKAEAAARAVLEAALAAKGGADKLAALKTLSWKGKATLNLPNGKVPAQVEKRYVAPDKLRLDMVIEMGGAKMSITTALAGDIGWAQEKRPDGSRTIDFPASEIEAGKAQIWRDQDFVLLRHREKGATVAPLDDVDVDGVRHHAIRVTAADGKRTVVLLIEKKAKRLAGMTYEEQGVSAEERFGNYKAVSGVQVAQTRKTKSAQVDLDTTVTDIKVNAPIDVSIYKKPADAKPAGKKPPPASKKPPPATPGPDPGAKTPPPGK